MAGNRGPSDVLFRHGALSLAECEKPLALHLLPPLEEIELRLANRWTVPFIHDGRRADMLAAFERSLPWTGRLSCKDPAE